MLYCHYRYDGNDNSWIKQSTIENPQVLREITVLHGRYCGIVEPIRLLLIAGGLPALGRGSTLYSFLSWDELSKFVSSPGFSRPFFTVSTSTLLALYNHGMKELKHESGD